MACAHTSVSGYAFCGQCGEPVDAPRCRCGFVGRSLDRFCGQCGQVLGGVAGEKPTSTPVASLGRRLPSLARLHAQAMGEQALAAPERKLKVDQADIRKLIASRRGKS